MRGLFTRAAAAILLGLLLPAAAASQSTTITGGSSLPSGCVASSNANGLFYKSGTGSGLKVCTAPNTWGDVGAHPTIAFGIVIDGAGATITTGTKGYIQVPTACTITKATVLSIDAAASNGSIVFDVWKDTYTNYPPTVADTITASAKPTLSSANKSQDSTLTGWTTSVAAGDILGFNVDSVSTLTRVILQLECLVN